MAKRTYSGPIYSGKIRNIAELNEAMKWLVSSGPLPGARKGNAPCNAGETIEAALGQDPSTRKIDFKLADGKVELKSGRQKISKPPDTLATRVLDSWTSLPYPGKSRKQRFDQFVNEFAFRTLMKIDGISGHFYRKNLLIRITNKVHKKTKLFLEYDDSESRLWVCEKTGKTHRRLLFYDQIDISALNEKMKLQYYADVKEVKNSAGKIEYDVVSVKGRRLKLGKLTPKIVFEQIKLGNLVIEFRAHICTKAYCEKTDCPEYKKKGIGAVRCRGTALRVPSGKVEQIFEISDIA